MEHHQINSTKVSRETFSHVDALVEKNKSELNHYLDQLLWWNKRVNLVSRDVSRGTLKEHVRHSLILSQFDEFCAANYIIDAGTGGGLPGIPLAINNPEKRFLLNDIVTKKITAVRQILIKLKLNNVEAEAASIENISFPPSSLLVSKHAFKINELWGMIHDQPWSAIVLYKGLDIESELNGIDDPLAIDLYDLSSGSQFYNGKALIVIKRG